MNAQPHAARLNPASRAYKAITFALTLPGSSLIKDLKKDGIGFLKLYAAAVGESETDRSHVFQSCVPIGRLGIPSSQISVAPLPNTCEGPLRHRDKGIHCSNRTERPKRAASTASPRSLNLVGRLNF